MAWPPTTHQDAQDEISKTLRVLIHNGTAYPARPSAASVPAGFVRYVGPTQPTDWLANDEWVNNA